MRRTAQLHTRRPSIGLVTRIFVAVLALPFLAGAVLELRRGAWADAALFAGMVLLAGYAAATLINHYARRLDGSDRALTRDLPHGRHRREQRSSPG